MEKFLIKLPLGIQFEKFKFDNDFRVIDEISVDLVNIDTSYHIEKYGFRLSESEVKTFYLHFSCWCKFLSSASDYCLITEENFNTNGFDLNIDFFADLPNEWDIYFPYEKELPRNSIELENPNSREEYDIKPFLLGFEWGSSVYYLSKRGANKLLKNISVVRQRVEDEMFTLSMAGKINLFYADCPSDTHKLISQKKYLDRENAIKEAVLNYNVWSDSDYMLIQDILSFLSSVSKAIKVKLLLQGGTHLGYIRHGGIMKWDDDVDLGINEEDFRLFREQILKSEFKITEFVESRTNTVFYKIWSEKGREVPGYSFRFPLVDLWLYKVVGKDFIFRNGIICKKSASEELLPIIFEGNGFYIPFNSISILDGRYSDWRTKIRIYSFSHATESERFHGLYTNIEVDLDGRIIY